MTANRHRLRTAIAAVVLSVFLLLGCVGCFPYQANEEYPVMDGRFMFAPSAQNPFPTSIIITDTETGVQYLYISNGYGSGLTVLVDETGKPLVSK